MIAGVRGGRPVQGCLPGKKAADAIQFIDCECIRNLSEKEGVEMDKEKARAKFVEEAEAVFERMWARDAERPQATLDEMAAELAPLRQELMGELLEELAQKNEDGRHEEVVCPACGEKMKPSGKRRRKALHADGEVKTEPGHHRCPECGRENFPPGSKAPPDAT